MKRLILALVLLYMVSGCNCSPERTETSGCGQWHNADTMDPLKLLQESQCFRIGPVGYAGIISPYLCALCHVFKMTNASTMLEELYATGTRTGRLYALLGLRFVNRAKYDEYLPQMKTLNGAIETQLGCIVFPQSIQVTINSIETGGYDADIQRELKTGPAGV
jgi:hypothetical protein